MVLFFVNLKQYTCYALVCIRIIWELIKKTASMEKEKTQTWFSYQVPEKVLHLGVN